MKITKISGALTLVSVLMACASLAWASGNDRTQSGIFETNVTNDLDISSGEPEIAIDPANPRELAIVEFAIGSAKVPAYSTDPVMVGGKRLRGAMVNDGRLMLSKDGGNTWTPRPSPLFDPAYSFGADPAIAYGPDGTLYVAEVLSPKDRAKSFDFINYSYRI